MILTASVDLLSSELFKHLWVLPGLVPVANPLLPNQKWTKPLTPRLATFRREGHNLGRTDQLAALEKGPRTYERPSEGLDGRRRKSNAHGKGGYGDCLKMLN